MFFLLGVSVTVLLELAVIGLWALVYVIRSARQSKQRTSQILQAIAQEQAKIAPANWRWLN